MGDPADAVPAVLTDGGEPFHAFEVNGNIGSFLVGGLFADGEGLVDIVDAGNFLSVGAVVSHFEGEGEGDEDQKDEDSHCRFYIYNHQNLISTLSYTTYTQKPSSKALNHR